MNNEFKLPFYAKASLLIIGMVAFIVVLYIGKSIIVPLVFATIFAIVLHPVVNFFVGMKINRLIAIIITLILTLIIILAFVALFLSQANRFSESWPALIDKFTRVFNETITDASRYFDINAAKIHEWFKNTVGELIKSGTASIGHTLVSVGNLVVVLFLVPVYVFMLLFYHPILIEFIRRLFGERNQSKVSEIVTQTKSVIQRYLIGLIIEAALVGTLNTVSLLIIGIEYAIILGFIGALLNTIPYIGGIISVAIYMTVAFFTKSPAAVIYILVVYTVIQFVDNHFIVPKIVASKVKINALFAIVAVIAGNALWGVAGMFLSIPLLAIVKLIFDHIEPLKPWGFLLGDTMPPLAIFILKLKKKKLN
jgi:predicted PurR-regulated permease PerM